MNNPEDLADPSHASASDTSDRWIDRHTHRIGPLILLGISAVVLVASFRLELGALSRPGPGLWPAAIATITGAMALVSAVLPRKDEERFRLHEVMRVVALMVVLLLFPVLFDYVGFVIPSMLVIVFMMRVLSKESWLRSLIVAVSTTALGYVLFGTFLNVRLPAFSMPF